jgi:hypothetical protein
LKNYKQKGHPQQTKLEQEEESIFLLVWFSFPCKFHTITLLPPLEFPIPKGKKTPLQIYLPLCLCSWFSFENGPKKGTQQAWYPS